MHKLVFCNNIPYGLIRVAFTCPTSYQHTYQGNPSDTPDTKPVLPSTPDIGPVPPSIGRFKFYTGQIFIFPIF